MAIFFAFSDENGDYRRWRTPGFLRAHPWYIRSTFCIGALEWKGLARRFQSLKENYELPASKEIKWSYAWSVRSHIKNGKAIPKKENYSFLQDYDPERLEGFLVDAVGLLAGLEYCRATFTVTSNRVCQRISESRLLKMHLQEALQRIEMDMQVDGSNLCVIFIDPASTDKDRVLREAYSELYRNGDLIERYRHIKDSLNLEHSHHSVGIQIADYLARAFCSMLNGRGLGKEIYRQTISRIIRRKQDGRVSGYGFREVPGNNELRQNILSAVHGALEP